MDQSREDFFIDTNVIIDNSLFQKIKDKDKIIEKLKLKIKPSFDFLNKHLSFSYPNALPFISPYSIIELYSGISKSITGYKMFVNNISHNYFDSYYRQTLNDIGEETMNEIKEFLTNSISKKKLQLFYIDFNKEEEMIEIMKLFVYGLNFADALIFYSAIKANCKYFVTTDCDFLKNKRLKKDYSRIIEIIEPKKALNVLEQLEEKKN